MKSEFSRRQFFQATGLAGAAGLIPHLQAQAFGTSTDDPDPSLLCGPEDGDVYLIGRRQGRVTIKVSKQQHGVESMSLLTEEIPPKDAIPVHTHGNEEEFIFVQQGTGIFTFGDQEYEVAPGAFVLVPRGVWHGLRNEAHETILMVFGYTPAGFEDYFRAIGVKSGQPRQNLTTADWARINGEFAITYR